MGLELRKRTTLFARGPFRVVLNWGTQWPSLTGKVGPASFNTRRGFSSLRLGRGLSWRDKD